MLAWHHISQSPQQTIWAHFVAASGNQCKSAGVNYVPKLRIKLSNCPNFLTSFAPSTQKCWPPLWFPSTLLWCKQFPKPPCTVWPAVIWIGRFPFQRGFLQLSWLRFLNFTFVVSLTELVIGNLNRFSKWVRKKLLECGLRKAKLMPHKCSVVSFCLAEVETALFLQQVYIVAWKETAVKKVVHERVATKTYNVLMWRNALKFSNNA